MGWLLNYSWKALSRTKPLERSLSQDSCTKTLTWYDLTAYGLSATVGSGIYVTCGAVAKQNAGPAVVFSILIAGVLAALTGICYLEFASALPISGSGYAYFYTLLGEFLGWLVGWNLTLEYAFAASAIARSWVGYLVTIFEGVDRPIPTWLYDYGTSWEQVRFNILAAIVIILIGMIVTRGLRFSAFFTNFVTILNICLILFIVIVGFFLIDTSNWKPFVPLPVEGIFSGAGIMFFSFIGYDTVSTLAADAINPTRDVPLAVLLTVGVATVLYMAIGIVLTGMQNFAMLDGQNPLALAFKAANLTWAYYIVTVCAMTTMAATMVTCLLGQPKIFLAMARDGLLPNRLASESKNGTPVFGIIVTTVLSAMLALFCDLDVALIDTISFGILLGMSTLCTGLLVVRFSQHSGLRVYGSGLSIVYLIGCIVGVAFWNAGFTIISMVVCGLFVFVPLTAMTVMFFMNGSRLASTSTSFTCPLMPLLPCIAVAGNTYVMLQLNAKCIPPFLIWTVIGLVIYFTYGIHHSQLGLEARMGEKLDDGDKPDALPLVK